MHGEKLSVRFEPAQDGAGVVVAPRRIDGAKKRMLEKPIELRHRRVIQKIPETKISFESSPSRALLRETNGRRCEIETCHCEASFRPDTSVMPRAATGHK